MSDKKHEGQNESRPNQLSPERAPAAAAPKKEETRLPYYESSPGNFRINVREGAFGKTNLNIDLLTAADQKSIDDVFDKILKRPDMIAAQQAPESAEAIQEASSQEDFVRAEKETHEAVVESGRQAVDYPGYLALRNFFRELTGANEVIGGGVVPRIAKLKEDSIKFVRDKFTKTFENINLSSSIQNRPIVPVNEVFVISSADGQRLKEIIKHYGKEDKAQDVGNWGLQLLIGGANINFIFHDAMPEEEKTNEPA